MFYNRLLRAFVLIDLKLGKLTHQDLGQIQMYTNFYDRFQREEGESPTIGIVLCSDKNDAMVKITLPEDNEQIFTPQPTLEIIKMSNSPQSPKATPRPMRSMVSQPSASPENQVPG